MSLVNWVVSFLTGVIFSFLIVSFACYVIEKLILKESVENVEKKTEKKCDLFILILFILSLIFSITFSYNIEVDGNYQRVELYKLDYSLYTASLKDERIYGEARYELINDIQVYNRGILRFHSQGSKIIGNPDLKSKIASLELIKIE